MKTQDSTGKALSTSVPDAFFQGYLDCALWASTDDDGDPLDGGHYELSDTAKDQILADCADFLAYCEETGIDPFTESAERSGHDFWLTRNGHGAGYWDRGLENGKELTDAAKTFGTSDIYLGDDGELHVA